MKKSLLHFSLILFTVISFSQSKEVDSLKKLVAYSEPDTILIKNYLKIAKYYLSVNIDSFSKYTDKAKKLSVKNNNYELAKIYDATALKYLHQSKVDSAQFFFESAIKELETNTDPITESTIYSNYSLLFQRKREINKAVKYIHKGIDLVKDNSKEVCLLYYNLAIMYMDLEMHGEAKKYLKLAYTNAYNSGDTRIEGIALAGLGHFFNSNKEIDSAKYFLKKGLDVCKRSANPQICHVVNTILGELYMDEKDYVSAKKHILNTRKYAEIRNSQEDLLRSYMFLARIENLLGDYPKSIAYFREFEGLHDNMIAGNVGVEDFRLWADIESKNNNFKESTRLLKKYISIKDSVLTTENRELLADLNAKYETEKKDKTLVEQQLQLQQQQNEIQKKNTQYAYMTGITVFLLVASALTWFIFQQRQKRKNQEILTMKRVHQVKTLESLIEGEEKERLRIAKELHDGVNGDLSAIKFKLVSLQEMNNKVINEAVEMIDKSCQQVRAISHNLIPPSLKSFNLIEATEAFCHNMDNAHNIKIEFHFIGEKFEMSKKDEVNIFRVIQELLNNSIKHAEASEINVQISHRDTIIHVTVEDDGKGFDINQEQTDGIGLKNIQSRVDYLQAEFHVVSNNEGSSFTIEIDKNKYNDH